MLLMTLAGVSSVALAGAAVVPEERTFTRAFTANDFVNPAAPPATLTFRCDAGPDEVTLELRQVERVGNEVLYRTPSLLWVHSADPASCREVRTGSAGSAFTAAGQSGAYQIQGALEASPARSSDAGRPLGYLAAAGTGARSSAVPSVVTDTLSILAEIAYEQAKSRAYDTVATGVRTQVCDRLVLVRPLPIGWTSAGGRWEITLPEGPLLPATCDAFEAHADFISLVNAADEVAAALVGDVVDFGSRIMKVLVEATRNGTPIVQSAWVRGEVLATLDGVAQVLRDNAVDGTPPDIADARQLLASFAARTWDESTPATDPEQAAQAALASAFVLLRTCVEVETDAGATTVKVCSAREVLAALDVVEAAQPAGPIRDTFHTLRPAVEALALDVLRLEVTSDRGDPTAVVQAAFRVAFDLIDLAFTIESRQRAPGTGAPSSAGGGGDLPLLAERLAAEQARLDGAPKDAPDDRNEAAQALVDRSEALLAAVQQAAGAATGRVQTAEADAKGAAAEEEKARKALIEAIAAADVAALAAAKHPADRSLAQAAVEAAKQRDEARSKHGTATARVDAAADSARQARAVEALAARELAWAQERHTRLVELHASLTQPGASARRLVAELVEVATGRAPGAPLGPDPQAFVLDLVHRFRGVVVNLAANDVGGALSEGCQILLTLLESDAGKDQADPEGSARWLLTAALRRVVPVVGVLASNAHSLAQAQANPEDAEALRAARKEALEGIIKASTNRTGRDGDWVLSLGANVGVQVVGVAGGAGGAAVPVFGWDVAAGALSTSAPPLTLPMGFAIQHLPDPRLRQFRDPRTSPSGPIARSDARVASYFGQPSERVFAWNGFHGQLSVVDLAQFLGPAATLTDEAGADDPGSKASADTGAADTGAAESELQWADFLMLGAQAGFAFGGPKDQLVLGVDVRYAPYADQALRASLFVSYYVPFFDLN